MTERYLAPAEGFYRLSVKGFESSWRFRDGLWTFCGTHCDFLYRTMTPEFAANRGWQIVKKTA